MEDHHDSEKINQDDRRRGRNRRTCRPRIRRCVRIRRWMTKENQYGSECNANTWERAIPINRERCRRCQAHAVVRDETPTQFKTRRGRTHLRQCRCREAERAITGLKRRGIAPPAGLAVAAILARLLGDHREADKAAASLRLALPDSGGDPYTWTAVTVALALQEWADGNHGSEAAPSLLPASTDIIRTLCSRAQSVGGEATDLLCLTLALHARVIQSPVLGSFLLGHLSEDASPAGATSGYPSTIEANFPWPDVAQIPIRDRSSLSAAS